MREAEARSCFYIMNPLTTAKSYLVYIPGIVFSSNLKFSKMASSALSAI
jgi:hypothetical protein